MLMIWPVFMRTHKLLGAKHSELLGLDYSDFVLDLGRGNVVVG